MEIVRPAFSVIAGYAQCRYDTDRRPVRRAGVEAMCICPRRMLTSCIKPALRPFVVYVFLPSHFWSCSEKDSTFTRHHCLLHPSFHVHKARYNLYPLLCAAVHGWNRTTMGRWRGLKRWGGGCRRRKRRRRTAKETGRTRCVFLPPTEDKYNPTKDISVLYNIRVLL